MNDSSGRRGMDKSLRNQYDDAVAENAQLKKQVEELQNKYVLQAEGRVMTQQVLYKLLQEIQKSDWRNKNPAPKVEPIITEAFQLSDDSTARAKVTMDKLEAATENDMKFNKKLADEAMKDLSASSQVEEMLNKFVRQNKQLRRDIKNRELYLKGETEMKQDFLKSLDKVVAMMKDKCDDKNLVELVVKKAATAPR